MHPSLSVRQVSLITTTDQQQSIIARLRVPEHQLPPQLRTVSTPSAHLLGLHSCYRKNHGRPPLTKAPV